jgi:multidrug efflux pump subunit AcrA (membrane-fusion protein)
MKFDREALQSVAPRTRRPSMDIAREPAQKKNRRLVLAGGIGLVVIATAAGVTRLKPALPSVERSSIIVDSVRRGDMVREVRGPGTLVPEQIRWISALTSARVERIVAQPGQVVQPNTVLLEMSNPDVQIQALQAQQALSEAQSRLVDMRVQLEGSKLSQQGAVATARTANVSAAQQKNEADTLLAGRLISRFEYNNKKALAEESNTRLGVEEKRLQLMTKSIESQLAVQQRQIERLAAIAAFQESRVKSLVVYAGESGVLQELSLEPGQWVNGGAPLAKIVQPGKLKAVLRVGEIQAKDVTIGQTVMIDTRNGIVAGRVSRMDPASQGGTVTIDVSLDGPLPRGARPDQSVDGTVQLERLRNVVFTGRPSVGDANSLISLYRLDPDGKTASRAAVRLGRVSANAVEIVEGLNPGDKVILSDLSLPDNSERIRIK